MTGRPVTDPLSEGSGPVGSVPDDDVDRPTATTGGAGAGAQWVDWRAAATIAARLGSPGPGTTGSEAADLVAELRDAAARAAAPVVEASHLGGLVTPAQARGPVPVLVVDRAGWGRANAQSMSAMTARVMPPAPRGVATATQVAATAEVAGVLAFLSRKVLGQFDPYGDPTAATGGRLLLAAPNVLEVERSLGAVPADFRLWVCLHELTHAFQFAAAPWLAEHLLERTARLTGSLVGRPGSGDDESTGLGRRFLTLVTGVAAAVVGRPGASLVEAALTPRERARLADVTAVMALLEGHADVMMDDVGPEVVPSVASLRTSFDARRGSATGWARVMNRLLGMEAKLAQYRDGAAFVRAVVDVVGHDGLNVVWTAPEHLPRAAEISEPALWLRRVHG